MVVHERLIPNEPLTAEETAMLERAAKMPIAFDEDCPEQTEEELRQFQPVTKCLRIPLPRKTADKARSLGDNYTEILSRALEDILTDENKLKEYIS